MRVSETSEIEGHKISCAIGRIEAASAWHPSGLEPHANEWRAAALEKLMREAAEFEADAIVELDYRVDGIAMAETAVPLQRVCAKGLAVRLTYS